MSSSYPMRPNRKRPVVSISESLKASTSKTRVNISHAQSFADEAPSGIGISQVSVNISTMVDDETLSSAPSQMAQPLPARQLPYVDQTSKYHPTKPVVSGFDRMNASIMELVERLPETTLDDKFDTVSKWIESFQVDVVPHKVAKELELIIDVANEHRREFGGPSTTKAIGCAFAMTQLMLVTTRIRPVLGPICAKVTEGILQSMFVHPPTSYSRQLVDVSLPREDLLRQLNHFRSKMFFQEARDTTKKLDSVQRFMILSNEIRANQKKVLGQALAHWHSFSKGFVFRGWRAAIKQRKAETKHHEEVAKLRVDLAMMEDKVAAMKNELAAKDQIIAEMKDTTKRVGEENDIVQMALKYDVMKLSDHNAVLQAEFDALKNDSEAEKQRILEMSEGARNTLNRLTQELRTFRANYFDASCRTVRQQSVVSALDSSDQVTDKSLLKWLRQLTASLEEETPDFFSNLHKEYGIKVAADIIAPVRLRAGGDLLSSIALCLRVLYPHALTDKILASKFLQQSTAEKAIALVRFCKQTGLPLPSCITDDVLASASEDGDVACKILLSVLAQAAANPHLIRTGSVLRADPFPDVQCAEMEALKGSVQGFGKWAAIAAAAGQYIYSSCMSMSDRGSANDKSPLTAAEVADESAFSLTPHSLSAIGIVGDAVDSLRSISQKHFPVLRHVFRHYDGTVDNTATAQLSEERFVSLVRDTRIAVAGVVDRAVVSNICSTCGPLSPRQFVVALVSLSTIRYPQTNNTAEAFRTLLEQNIKPFAERPDFSYIHHLLRESGPLAQTMDEVRNDLFKLFRRYCNQAPNKMALDDFKSLMKDTKTSDSASAGTLDIEDVEASFKAVLVSPQDEGITFDSFVHLCIIVALMKIRQPWIAAELRARRYILSWLIEPLKKKAGLQYAAPI